MQFFFFSTRKIQETLQNYWVQEYIKIRVWFFFHVLGMYLSCLFLLVTTLNYSDHPYSIDKGMVVQRG